VPLARPRPREPSLGSRPYGLRSLTRPPKNLNTHQGMTAPPLGAGPGSRWSWARLRGMARGRLLVQQIAATGVKLGINICIHIRHLDCRNAATSPRILDAATPPTKTRNEGETHERPKPRTRPNPAIPHHSRQRQSANLERTSPPEIRRDPQRRPVEARVS